MQLNKSLYGKLAEVAKSDNEIEMVLEHFYLFSEATGNQGNEENNFDTYLQVIENLMNENADLDLDAILQVLDIKIQDEMNRMHEQSVSTRLYEILQDMSDVGLAIKQMGAIYTDLKINTQVFEAINAENEQNVFLDVYLELLSKAPNKKHLLQAIETNPTTYLELFRGLLHNQFIED